MALNFPNAPADGQQYTHEGRTWEWSETLGVWSLVPVSDNDAVVANAAAAQANLHRNFAEAAATSAGQSAAAALASENNAAESENNAAESEATALATLPVQSATPPAEPLPKVDWIDTTTGKRYTNVGSTAAPVWVEVMAAMVVDNPALVSQLRGELESDTGATLVGFKQSGAGAVDRTLADKAREVVSVKDFGAVGDGVTDDTGAFAAALLSSSVANPKRILATGEYQVSSITVGAYDCLGGEKQQQALIKTEGVTVAGSYSEVCNVRLETAGSDNYALAIPEPATTYDHFGNLFRDIRVTGKNGILNGGFETKLQNVYGVGAGQTNGGNGIEITQWDTSINTVFLQNYGTAIRSIRGLQSVDAHVVRANIGISLQSQGHPAHLVNTYLDTPGMYGLSMIDMSNAAITNVTVLNVGTAETASSAAGMLFDKDSKNSNISNVHFVQLDDTKWANAFHFSDGSVNHLMQGIGGAYKMSAPMQERMRKQTIIGAHGKWARHTNVPRLNRAHASNVEVNAEVTLEFKLDYEYPALEYTTILFVGNYASRNMHSQSAVGEILVPIQFDEFGCAPVLEKKTGHANNEWVIVTASLASSPDQDGSVLSITFKNTGTQAATMSVEVRRSIDAKQLTY